MVCLHVPSPLKFLHYVNSDGPFDGQNGYETFLFLSNCSLHWFHATLMETETQIGGEMVRVNRLKTRKSSCVNARGIPPARGRKMLTTPTPPAGWTDPPPAVPAPPPPAVPDPPPAAGPDPPPGWTDLTPPPVNKLTK